MAAIYKDTYETLETLLDQASSPKGANLLIPDLQRPYVWSPTQVTYLVDSLVRGWPFGSLLLWSVGQDDVAKMPSRTFYQLVDRIEDEPKTVPEGKPPASFRMVLDGQQRVQSLLLAFGGDSWGFKMPDRDWHQAVNDKRPRGQYRVKHWTVGELCVDLPSLLKEFTAANRRVPAMEFAKALRWVVRDGKKGQSKHVKKPNYDEPLPLAFAPENRGRFVRLSRLWDAFPGDTSPGSEDLETFVAKTLADHEVPAANQPDYKRPLTDIVQTLHGVKKTRVTFLEVVQYKPAGMGTPEAYSDAVVSIFTRLNTAGRTLTREEITFAWVKAGWNIANTGNKGASDCFKALATKLQALDLSVTLDDLVSVVSFLWAVCFRGGKILSNADLLKGDQVRPMANQLSAHWNLVEQSILHVAQAVKTRGLFYRRHFQSLNSLAILFAWRFTGQRWLNSQTAKQVEQDAWSAAMKEAFDAFCDRWLISSQWAGRWGESAPRNLESYATTLAKAAADISAEKDVATAVLRLRTSLDSMVAPLTKDATDHIDTLEVESRELVRAYYLPLWLWHRLDEERWASSSIPLRTRKANGTLDVDHIVSVGLWKDLKFDTASPPNGDEDDDVSASALNTLGNCWLLETTFNIAKNKRPAGKFLEDVYEFKKGALKMEDWSKSIGIESVMLGPTEADGDAVASSIGARTQVIKSDLKAFINGTLARADIAELVEE